MLRFEGIRLCLGRSGSAQLVGEVEPVVVIGAWILIVASWHPGMVTDVVIAAV
jgi:hypothetical protein